jgi:hypothetical protein
MPRFKAHIRDGRRKLADLEVDVSPPRPAPRCNAACMRSWSRAEHAAAQVSQAGLKLEEAKTKKLLGCARLQRKRAVPRHA